MFRLLKKYTQDAWWAACLGPLFTIIEVIFDALIPLIMANIIDVGMYELNGDIDYIIKQGLYMVVLAFLAAASGSLSGLFSSVSSTSFVKNIRKAEYRKLQTFDFENIEKYPVSTIVMRFTTDLRMLRMAYVSIVRMLIRAPFNLAISAYYAYKLNAKLASIFVIVLPILATGLFLILSIAHPRFKQMMLKYDALDENLEENVNGIKVVKSFVREDYENNKFNNSSKILTKAQRFAENIIILNRPFFELAMYSVMIIVAYIGGNDIIAMNMKTGDFMAFLAYVKAVLFALLMISTVIMQVVMAQSAIDRANEILDEEPTIYDDNSDENLQIISPTVEFKNVSFKYSKDAENNVLNNINLKIEAGETIGILGPTGAGKSSLVQLIPRLYDVSEGEILIDNHNIKEYKLANLRNKVAMVLQKNTLFSGSIKDNLKWGDENASDDEIKDACDSACASEFISKLPGGYNYDLGQGGLNVSGGQKQRLCIARALLKKPKIIILDDSTSAVDTDTDHKIQLALKEKLQGMTTIIIAQRVSSIKEANRIVMMNEGQIVDIGSHDELYARNNIYHDLYDTQSKGALE